MLSRLGLVLIALLVPASAARAQPPANDAYLAAVAVNAPGDEMPRDRITTPPVPNAEATLQTDLFAPGPTGGPGEPNECDGVGVANTIWYRFFPDLPGKVTIESVGFDTTLAVLPFESAADPSPQGSSCSAARDDVIESLELEVERGLGYAVQVGGANGATGTVQVNLQFAPDRDGDGVTDDDDDCPRRKGTVGGCPPKIAAGIAYQYGGGDGGGVTFRFLEVKGAPTDARIDVRCSRGCPRMQATVKRKVTRIKGFTGRQMPTGATVEVRVTKKGYIGAYRQFKIGSGNVRTTDRCLPPGSTKPKKSCK